MFESRPRTLQLEVAPWLERQDLAKTWRQTTIVRAAHQLTVWQGRSIATLDLWLTFNEFCRWPGLRC